MNRKTTFLKSLAAIVMLLAGTCFVQAQLLVENFDYPVGTELNTLTAAGLTPDPITGWIAHSGNGTQNIKVTEGLVFEGYAGSGVGGAANVAQNGQDINKPFEAQTSGLLYTSILLKTESTNSQGYFFHLGPNPIGSTFFTRLWVNSGGNGINVTNGSTAPSTWISITPGTTYLVVFKHNFTDKKTSMYVLSSFSASEPVTANTVIDETLTTVSTVALRQYSTAQRIVVDGIRVANTWELAVAPGGAVTNKVATPAMNPGTGNYFTAQSVTITSATEGAAIYYTLDGSDPDETKSLFATPVNISATTTLRARAYKAGMDPSNIFSAVYTFPTNVADIATLRQHTSGFYKFTGKATFTLISTDNVRGNPKYAQDATGGILIYDPDGKMTTTYQIGDGVTNLIGTLGVFSGMLQFTPVTDAGAAIYSGNPVTPAVIPLADLINHPAKLVTVKNAIIAGTGNFAASTNYNLNGAANPVLRTAYTDLPYIGQPIPTTEQDITGVVLMFNTTAQLVPRTLADFNTSTGLAKLSADYKVYASAGALMVESPKAERLEVYNTLGQLVHSSLLQAGMNSVLVPEGLLIVKIGNQVAKVLN
jgi:hypothetical protein